MTQPQPKQEPRLDNLIDNSDNLDEQLSVVEFIKTLKKADSTADSLNGKSAECSSSPSQDSADEKRKLGSGDKRSSASELLSNMRRRFVHRATEPVFSVLEQQAKGAEGYEEGGRTRSSGGGSDNQLRMPPFEACNPILLDRKTDSEPTLSSTSSNRNRR